MVRDKGRGLDVRAIYETRPDDLMEGQVFQQAFAKVHDINGHKILCVLVKSRSRALNISLDGESRSGAVASDSVLLVDSREVSGMHINESLRIDGHVYLITHISTPIASVTRLELAGYE